MQTSMDRFVTGLIDDVKNNRLKLPTLPEVAFKVRGAMNNPDTPAAQIAKIVNTDAALTTRLLQVANSPLFRGTSRIENVQTAIARLGLPQVRDLVTSLIMKQLYQTKAPSLRERMFKLWEHSSLVAAISHVLARKVSTLKPDQAMLAGLIHEIGALPIISKAEHDPQFMRNDKALDEATEKLHPSIGRLILEAWKFPPEFAAVAAYHEDFTYNSSKVDYVDVVLVANLHSYVGTNHRHAGISWKDIPSFAKLGLTPDESVKALEEARSDIIELKNLLSV